MGTKKHKPHPPANPEWPDHVKAVYAAGCARIDELRKQVDDDGVVPLPFRCYSCDGSRDDFGLLTGDGVPICMKCIGGMEAALEGAAVT